MNLHWLSRILRVATAIAALVAGTLLVRAETTDISTVPLGTSPVSAVLPNLMFILDDSGSMDWEYMPDQVNDSGTCKSCGSVSCNIVGAACNDG